MGGWETIRAMSSMAGNLLARSYEIFMLRQPPRFDPRFDEKPSTKHRSRFRGSNSSRLRGDRGRCQRRWEYDEQHDSSSVSKRIRNFIPSFRKCDPLLRCLRDLSGPQCSHQRRLGAHRTPHQQQRHPRQHRHHRRTGLQPPTQRDRRPRPPPRR